MSVKVVSQETFDAVVYENMREFDMTAEEALDDAEQQFRAQGVNIKNIVKDVALYTSEEASGDKPSQHAVIIAINSIDAALNTNSFDDKLISNISTDLCRLTEECNIDLARRCLAGKHGAFPLLVRLCQTSINDSNDVASCRLLVSALTALCALCDGQPDLIDCESLTHFVLLLDMFSNKGDILQLLLKLITLNCLKHESNRQSFVSEDIISKLMNILQTFKDDRCMVKEACLCLRVLTFDDDVRVPFGKAHEHARLIAADHNGLKVILQLCYDYTEELNVLGELFATLSQLAVKDEFCKLVLDEGGIQLILISLQKAVKKKSPAVVRQILTLLKTLAGNDDVKRDIVNENGVTLIVDAMNHNEANAGVVESGCGLLATVVLRNPSHCDKAVACGAHYAVVQAMKVHAQQVNVQIQACMALRNLVSRNEHLCEPILELGAESLITMARANHKQCEDEAKAALRDLGCKVDLRERWTGQRGTLEA